MKRMDEMIDKDVLGWFGHMERMDNNRTAQRVYVGEWVGCRRVGLIP